MPTKQEVIDLVNAVIVANGNNEITANVLNPVLLDIINQINDLTGDLGDLNETAKDLVEAINNIINGPTGTNQKVVSGNYELLPEDDGTKIYFSNTVNTIITINPLTLSAFFYCEFENLTTPSVTFAGDYLVLVESVSNPVYLVGNVLQFDDSCEIRRQLGTDSFRIKDDDKI